MPDEREPLLRPTSARGRRDRWACSYVIEPLLFLYMASDFPTGPMAKQVLFKKVANEHGLVVNASHNNSTNNTNHCLVPNANKSNLEIIVAKEVADWDFRLSAGEALVNLISLLIWGTLIDAYGRRISFILPPIGDILYCAVYMLVIKLDLPIPFLFLRLVRPLFGYSGLMVLGCFTYVADTVHESQRAFRMTLIDVVFYVSGAGSAIAIARFIPKTDLAKFFWAFLAVICGKLLAFLYAVFLVPETLPSDATHSNNTRERLSFASLKRGLSFLIVDNGEGRRWRFWTLIGVYVVNFVFYAAEVFHIFVLIRPLCWQNGMYLDFSAYNLVVHCVGALLCTKLLGRWLHESWQAVLGQLSGAVLFFYWCLIINNTMMFFMPVCGIFSFVVVPLSKSMLSKLVDQQEQGATFAIFGCMQQLVGFVNSLVVYKTYRLTLQYFNGRLTFFISGWLRVVGLFMLIIYAMLSRNG